MHRYTLYCTEEQTKKALELGAPIEVTAIYSGDHETGRDDKVHISEHLAKSAPYQEYATIPTAEQMIGWLEERSMFCEIRHYEYFYHSYVNDMYLGHFSTRKEATIAAIDAALEYLTNNK